MPIIVACPSCAGQLRVADDLIGRKVRCPACGTTFEAQSATPSPAPAAPSRPAESEKVDAWKFLNLELSDDPTPPGTAPVPLPRPASSTEPKRRGDPDRGESIPIPPAPLEPPEESDEPRGSRRPRLNNNHDDVFDCPSCGRSNHRDERRCYHCGERFRGGDEDDRPRPRRRRRQERRDTEPHRGGFILAMGITSLVLLLFCAPISIVPGLIGWICGQSDMRKMRDKTMDEDGEGTTQAGWICSIIGTILGGLVLLGCGTVIGLGIYSDVERSRNMNRPKPVMPVPQRVPGQKF